MQLHANSLASAAHGKAHVALVDLHLCTKRAKQASRCHLTALPHVAQIFVRGRSVGGSDDLARQLGDGSFQQLLKQQAAGAGGALPPELLAAVLAAQEAAAARAKVCVQRVMGAQGQGTRIPFWACDNYSGCLGRLVVTSADGQALHFEHTLPALKVTGMFQLSSGVLVFIPGAQDAGAAAASGEGAALAGLEARMLREAAEGGLPRSSKAFGWGRGAGPCL